MLKIISKKEYDEIIRLLKEACVIIKSLDADNKKLQEENTKLRNENEEFRRVIDKSMISCIYGSANSDIDFPNSSKELRSSGDTNY